MDDTNPGNRPLDGTPGGSQNPRPQQPQPPQYQRASQQPGPQQGYPPQNQWGPQGGQQGPYQQNPQQWGPGPQGQQGPYQQQYPPQNQWGLQGGPQGPQNQWGPGPQGPQPQYQQQPPQQQDEKKSKGGLIAALIAILALILIAVLAWGYTQQGWFFSDSSRNSAGSTMTQGAGSDSSESSDASESSSAPSSEESSSARPEDPNLPGSAVPVNDAARNGEPAGDFNNVYRGSDITSEPFSLAVRDAFVEQWIDTKETDVTIDVYSTVTGQTYAMSCSDNGRYITCTGGNNAIVYIA